MARRGRPRKDGTSGDATDLHIIAQLKNTIDLDGEKVLQFRNGDTTKVSKEEAYDICAFYEKLHSIEKTVMQDYIGHSLSDFQSFINTTIKMENSNASMGKQRSSKRST